MSFIIGVLLVVFELVAAVVVAIAIPAVLGLIAWDVREQRKLAGPTPSAKDSILRIASQRGVARGFVILGGAFWTAVLFVAYLAAVRSGEPRMNYALIVAFLPVVACAATLIIGWYYERAAAALLAAATVAAVAWGVIYQFEMGVWMIMTFTLLGPIASSAALFWMARREQEAYEAVHSMEPQLALVFAARSSISN